MSVPSVRGIGIATVPLTSAPDAALTTALDRFLRGVERRALRHAELALRHPDDALEAVQECMLRFVKHYRHKPAAEWPLLFWRVLDSRLVDTQRRRRLFGRWFSSWFNGNDDEAEDTIAALPDPREPGPLARLHDAEATQALEAALQALPQRQREAFLLRVWEGLDVAETAAALGISEGSVKTHLFRALQALRARLEGYL